VREQRHLAGVGRHLSPGRTEFDAVDGFVGSDVDVCGLVRQLPFVARRNGAEAVVLAACGDIDVHARQLLDRGAAPVPAHNVVDALAGIGEVEGDQRLLRGRATGREQHRVIVRHGQQLAQVGLGLPRDGQELRAAVADLDHRCTGVAPLEHVGLCLAQDRFGQCGRTGTEVVCACHRASRVVERGALVCRSATAIPAADAQLFAPCGVQATLPEETTMSLRSVLAIPASDVTDETVYRARRRLLGAFAGASLLPLAACAEAEAPPSTAVVTPEQARSGFRTDEVQTRYEDITGYNNFYEFGTDKADPSRADKT